MELHQKTLLATRSFFLLDNQIKLYLKAPIGEYENYVAYEKIKPNILIYYRQPNQLLYIALLLTGFSTSMALSSIADQQNIIYLILVILLVGFILLFYKFKPQKYLIIETLDNKKIIFLKDKPSAEDLHFFIICLWHKRKYYLRKKYFYLDLRNNLQQEMARLRWLLEQKVITHREFILAKDDWIVDRRN